LGGIGDVLRGVQGTSILIGNTKKAKVLDAYAKLVGTDRFRGVGPVTLEIKNMTKEMDEKMEDVIESQTEGWMPMDSYTLIHKEAILTADEKNAIIAYANAIRSSLGNVNSAGEEVREKEEK
jgi:hypothetical protein